MTDIELAQKALVFLQRANLQGAEVPTFLEVARWLNTIAQSESTPTQADA